MTWLSKTLRSLDEWWFGWHSPAALGVLRILFGALCAFSLSMLLLMFPDFYADSGFAPTKMISDWMSYDSNALWSFRMPFGLPRLSLLGTRPPDGLTLAMFIVTIVASLSYMVGFFSRISGFMVVLGLISIHTRNPLIIHSGDTLMRLCLIYLAFSPAGAMYSVDAWIKRRRLGPIDGMPPQKVRVIGQRLIAFQIAVVYLYTVWWKVSGTYWMDGTATWYPAQMHEFARFPMPEVFERQPFLALQTYGTLAVEIALGTLVFWRPARKIVLILGILMHAYIEYRFNIPMFALVIVSGYVAFYDGEEVRDWVARMKARLGKRSEDSESAPANA